MTKLHTTLKFFAWLFSGVVLANLSACGAMSSVSNFVLPSGSRLDWTSATLIAASDANLNTPVAVDLVMVRDAAALSAVTSMSAAKWFGAREDLLRTFPTSLRYVSLEITPGQTLKLTNEKIGSDRLAGAVFFANFLTPGEHRMRVDQLEGAVVVRLGSQSFSVATTPTGQAGR